MKKLFIYYSHTGNGDFVAEELQKKGYDIRKVIEKSKMPKSFFMQMMKGGFRAARNKKGKLIDYNPDVSDYDEIVIGSPIWNGRIPPAINSVLAETNLNEKKVFFLFYSGSGEGKVAEAKAKELFPFANVIFLKTPKSNTAEMEKIANL